MNYILLRSLNYIGWCYAYLGLLYALYFVYFIVVPAYREQNLLTNSTYVLFNIIFLFVFSQGYANLIRTTYTPIPCGNEEKSHRYCPKCLKYTRERSHHCKICQTCIPVQDHHCYFVATCIGEHNQRYFILMLFYLLCAHFIGYLFVSDYLWSQLGGFQFLTIFKVIFFNIGYLIGFVETKWQAFICVHHYLVYFDIVFIGRLFYQIMKRSLNGQTEYEEKKMISRKKQSFSQIFGTNKWIFIFPFSRL